jgi:biotin carboxylase
MNTTRNDSLPSVIVPYGSRSIPVLQLAASAEGVCNLVWLVRGSDPECAAMDRLLRRLGEVVDVEGLSLAESAEVLAPFAPAGAVAFRDDDLVFMASVARALRLPFHRPDVALCLVDKCEQRRALAAGGLDVPQCWEIPARRDRWFMSALLGDAVFPAVLKPRQGSGSRHTFLVESAAQLVETLEAVSHDPGGREDMVLEEFLPSSPGAETARFADYVSVETMVDADGFHHFALTGRLHQAAPFRETGFFIPSDLGAAATDSVLETASAALEALGVTFGCAHTEIKLTPAGPRVIEVNGRLGGGIGEMLQAAAGIDPVRLHLRQALGERAAPEGLVRCERVGYRLFHQPPLSARRILGVDGLQEIGELPGVAAVGLHLSAGDPVDGRQGTRSFVFSVVGTTAAPAEVPEVNRRICELAHVSYEHVRTEPATQLVGV